VLQGVANLFADGSSTGLTEDANRASDPANTLRQELNLRGFPTAFRSFEGYEYSAHGLKLIRSSDAMPALAGH